MPHTRDIMDAFTDPAVEIIVLMKSAQIAGTECMNNMIGYAMRNDPGPMLVVQPTEKMAIEWSKDRLDPMLRDTPALTGLVRDRSKRDSENTISRKAFPGGYLSTAWANSPATLASKPIRYFFGDEIDRWPPSAGKEGDPVNLARKRTTTYWNRKIVLVSTPTIEGHSRIEKAYKGSDMRKFWVPCPYCGEYQVLKWAQVKGWRIAEGVYDPGLAYYECEHCKGRITDADTPRMYLNGQWRAEGEFRGIAGFHINELYSPFVSFAEIVSEFVSVKDDPEQLKTWVNTSLGEPWVDRSEQINEAPLIARCRPYPAEVPAGGAVLTCGVDVQINRLEAEVVAWGKGYESWGVEHRIIPGDPDLDDVWHDLDEYLLRPFRHESGLDLHILCTAIDSGYKSEKVYNFVRSRQFRRVYAVKGKGGPGLPLAGLPKRGTKARRSSNVDLITVGTDTAKDYIYGCLKITRPGPGYCNFPASPQATPENPNPPNGGYDDEFFRQLTAEKAVYEKGKRKYIKKSEGRRVEALDIRVYATAALRILNPVNIDRLVDDLQARAERVQAEGKQAEKPAAKQHRPRKRARWIDKGWRQ